MRDLAKVEIPGSIPGERSVKFHYFYVIENLVNGKLYGGKHSTEDIDDGYMGSGKAMKRAIKKHGVQNFKKHILMFCETEEEAYEIERQIVDEDFVRQSNTYNLIVGGDSFKAINADVLLRKEKNRRAAIAMNSVCWSDPEFRKRKSDAVRRQTKRLFAEGVLKGFPDWTGKHHKQSSKDAIGQANSIHQTGEGNVNFGHVWVSNHEFKTSRSVLKQELEIYLERGWVKGRKMKW